MMVSEEKQLFQNVKNKLIRSMEWLQRGISSSLYHKFIVLVICVGLIPMAILTTFIVSRMLKEYRWTIFKNYQQTNEQVNRSINNVIKGFDDTTKMMYYYDVQGEFQTYSTANYRNLAEILKQDSDSRLKNMNSFLQTVQSVDNSISAVHFIATDKMGESLAFHYSRGDTYFESEAIFEKAVDLKHIDRNTRKAFLIPTHRNNYYFGADKWVFTIARNYFEVSEELNNKYVGTLFMDISLNRLEDLSQEMENSPNNQFYIFDQLGNCYYSHQKEDYGKTIEQILPEDEQVYELDQMISQPNSYGIQTLTVLNSDNLFSSITRMRNVIYLVLILSLFVLIFSAITFSRKLVRPIQNMAKTMAHLEKGDFSVRLPVESDDEIGALSLRFNQMSEELEQHINQVYVAQVKQVEAEMTALKSQIYPHFLYNTLEVIRMTAVAENDEKVARMLEALSIQIHYIIGPVQDMVPLSREIEIIQQYIYLLNCRNDEQIIFEVDCQNFGEVLIPKMSLQPIVENAFKHGLKPKGTTGNITIDVEKNGQYLVISVMDNGKGMSQDKVQQLVEQLQGEDIGIKDAYDWQSIGLKNVNDRIRYLFGKEYGIQISSSEILGTIISILIPFPIDGGDTDENDNRR